MPGGRGVRLCTSSAQGAGSILGQGTKILHAVLLNKFMRLNKLIINLKKNFFNGLWRRRKMTGFELKGRRRTRMGSIDAQDSFKEDQGGVSATGRDD